MAKFPGLNADENGLPVRWTFDGPTGAGFSDHLPVSARFQTVTDGRKDRYLALRNASDGRVASAPRRTTDYSKIDPEKVAVKAGSLSAGVDIRTADYKGKVFRVEGRVAEGTRLAVEFRGEVYDVWSHDEALRAKLRADYAEGSKLSFYGELGQYRGRWQFVIRDPGWVK